MSSNINLKTSSDDFFQALPSPIIQMICSEYTEPEFRDQSQLALMQSCNRRISQVVARGIIQQLNIVVSEDEYEWAKTTRDPKVNSPEVYLVIKVMKFYQQYCEFFIKNKIVSEEDGPEGQELLRICNQKCSKIIDFKLMVDRILMKKVSMDSSITKFGMIWNKSTFNLLITDRGFYGRILNKVKGWGVLWRRHKMQAVDVIRILLCAARKQNSIDPSQNQYSDIFDNFFPENAEPNAEFASCLLNFGFKPSWSFIRHMYKYYDSYVKNHSYPVVEKALTALEEIENCFVLPPCPDDDEQRGIILSKIKSIDPNAFPLYFEGEDPKRLFDDYFDDYSDTFTIELLRKVKGGISNNLVRCGLEHRRHSERLILELINHCAVGVDEYHFRIAIERGVSEELIEALFEKYDDSSLDDQEKICSHNIRNAIDMKYSEKIIEQLMARLSNVEIRDALTDIIHKGLYQDMVKAYYSKVKMEFCPRTLYYFTCYGYDESIFLEQVQLVDAEEVKKEVELHHIIKNYSLPTILEMFDFGLRVNWICLSHALERKLPEELVDKMIDKYSGALGLEDHYNKAKENNYSKRLLNKIIGRLGYSKSGPLRLDNLYEEAKENNYLDSLINEFASRLSGSSSCVIS